MTSLNAVSDDLLFQTTIYRAPTGVTWCHLPPTIRGHFEGGNLITSWSCEVFQQDFFDVRFDRK